MHFLRASIPIFVALLASGVKGHGMITSPTPRAYGAVAESACGEAVFKELTSNLFGPIENSAKVEAEDPSFSPSACPLFFCRGASIEDNVENTRVLNAGDVLNIKVELEARHTGFANVSIVNLASQTTMGSMLFDWPLYANDSLTAAEAPANETNFDVTIPDLGGACSEVGTCAIQWWWFATAIDQTYESCVDFTQ